MKLIPANGSLRMQKALSRSYLRDIVSILLQDQALMKQVAPLIQRHASRMNLALREDLERLHTFVNKSNPEYATKLIQALQTIYAQSDEDIAYLRGALVELYAYELVRSRCQPSDCRSNHRFIDGKYASDQIDIVVLSDTTRQVEGYECKLKANGIETTDCTNLSFLANVAQQQLYAVNVGIVSFDGIKYLRRRILRVCLKQAQNERTSCLLQTHS